MMPRLIAPALAAALGLASTSAGALDLDAMTDAERVQFGAEVRAYLMENPQVIMDAVEQLQMQEAQAQAQADVALVTQNADAIFDDGYSWVGGNPEGDITLVEFLDYRCGYCKRAHDEVAELIESDGNIRFIVKELPILGEDSLTAARFAIATKQVAGDDAYHAMNDALMAYNGAISPAALTRLADGLQLDGAAIAAHMQDDAVTEEIAKTRALAQALQISGTPTFVMQDELLRGYLPLDQMQSVVAEKRG